MHLYAQLMACFLTHHRHIWANFKLIERLRQVALHALRQKHTIAAFAFAHALFTTVYCINIFTTEQKKFHTDWNDGVRVAVTDTRFSIVNST